MAFNICVPFCFAIFGLINNICLLFIDNKKLNSNALAYSFLIRWILGFLFITYGHEYLISVCVELGFDIYLYIFFYYICNWGFSIFNFDFIECNGGAGPSSTGELGRPPNNGEGPSSNGGPSNNNGGPSNNYSDANSLTDKGKGKRRAVDANLSPYQEEQIWAKLPRVSPEVKVEAAPSPVVQANAHPGPIPPGIYNGDLNFYLNSYRIYGLIPYPIQNGPLYNRFFNHPSEVLNSRALFSIYENNRPYPYYDRVLEKPRPSERNGIRSSKTPFDYIALNRFKGPGGND